MGMEPTRTTNPALRLVRLVGGGLLLLLGLVGLALPVLPGWLFIIPGLSLWSTEFVWAARLRRRATDEWEKLKSTRSSRDDRAA